MLRNPGLFALVFALAAPQPRPKEAAPSDWPVERFVHNLEAQLAADPEDASAHYILGRVHSFAFALQRTTLLGGGSEEFTFLKDLADQPAASAPTMPAAERLVHLREGVRHLRRACELQDIALHHLTLAWALEAGAPLAAQVDTVDLFGLQGPASADERGELERWLTALASKDAAEAAEARRRLDDPTVVARATAVFGHGKADADAHRREAVEVVVQRYWLEYAIAEYQRCLERVAVEELFDEVGPLARVPREALEAYRRLVRARGVHGPEEERRLAEADARWKELDGKPYRDWISPVLFALDRCASLDELLAPNFVVPFDLDGDGVDELWPWLAPGTGWLVWDPERRGEITSGRQLFGSASAWLFFEDGYRVLDALDDDRSGELRGHELTGIAVWFDRDSDGVSDCGEVVPVEELGIVVLATESTLQVGHSPANLCGLEMSDGRVLPTYDWVLEPTLVP